ncbi:hypothetical protein QE152_g34108 [Popillia japonica]|uniref:Uncharacterized protein n=1 Tax=Popillia japonica TaxID=7064 RepID=A0AAW1IUR5_POPJA
MCRRGAGEEWISGIRSLGEYLDETDESAVFRRRSSISRTPPQSTSSGQTMVQARSHGPNVPEAGIVAEELVAEGKDLQWMDEEIRTRKGSAMDGRGN